MARSIDDELDRQRDTLVTAGYPEVLGLSATGLAELVEGLREPTRAAVGPRPLPAPSRSRVPFVVVVSAGLARAEDLVPLTHLPGGSAPGVVDRNHGAAGLAPYRPLPELGVPATAAYVLLDVDRGEEFCGVRPEDALPVIRGRGRTPLTIHEGIALVTLFPEVLEPNRCFMLSGSRQGDRRVPALWISGKAPKLGWCWDGNPHTWLGTASAAGRVAGADR